MQKQVQKICWHPKSHPYLISCHKVVLHISTALTFLDCIYVLEIHTLIVTVRMQNGATSSFQMPSNPNMHWPDAAMQAWTHTNNDYNTQNSH